MTKAKIGSENDIIRDKLLQEYFNDNENFDRVLNSILQETNGSQLLTIPGIYEIVSEHYNNSVLRKLEREFDEQNADVIFCAACEQAIEETELSYTLQGNTYCSGCITLCNECNKPIYKQQWINGKVMWGDSYDEGANFPDPRDMHVMGICVDCFEAIPTCCYCGNPVEEHSDLDSEGYGECCRESHNPNYEHPKEEE